MLMKQVIQFIEAFNVEIILCTLLAFFILLILYIIAEVRISKMEYRYKELVHGTKDINIEELLIQNGHDIDDLREKILKSNKELSNLNTKLTFTIQKVGFVRYNAFADMGSELSFSIAFLDGFSNGFVLTSIYNREQSTCYAKPIKNGKSIYPLSVEEMQSIDRAIKGDLFQNIV